jgi:hypothetical protein
MTEVVVFGVVAADVILRVQRIPVPGDQVNGQVFMARRTAVLV